MPRIILVLLCIILQHSSVLGAEPADTLTLKGNIRDAYTYDYLDEVSVELLSPADSSVVCADSCHNLTLGFEEWHRKWLRQSHTDMGDYILYKMRVVPGEYLLRCTREGYSPQVVALSIPTRTYGRRTKEWKAPDVMMMRQMQQQLGEATVHATKILMVNKGDTVVFNADYFQLAQGNMLDQLVKMLPGMEIRDGGQIYYNGSLLSNLYVNGKDFFNGDPKVALQNLPAYMVKKLKVYKKEEEDAYLDRHRDTVSIKIPNTLDVTLKKEYNKGWMANMQLGGGPAIGTSAAWNNAKYQGKIFAQYYQDNMRLSIIGNVNNISNTEVANDEGTWSPGWYQAKGVLKLAYGGINYNASSKKRKLDYVLNMVATSEVTDHESRISSTTFLNTSDTYSRSHDVGQEQHPHIYMNHSLRWTGDKFYVYAFLGADYFDDRSDWTKRSAQFTADPSDSYRGASLDSLFATPYSQRLADILTNRMEQNTMSQGTTWWQISRLNFSFKDPLLGNKMNIYTWGMLTHKTSDKFEHYDLRYPDPAANDFRNRYTDYFRQSYHTSVIAQYSFSNMMSQELADKLDIRLEYGDDFIRAHGHSWLYNLHRIEGWGNSGGQPGEDAPQTPPLGTLPSVTGWREQTGVPDANSNDIDSKRNIHNLEADIRAGKFDSRWGYFQLKPSLTVRHERYADSRTDEEAERRLTAASMTVSYTVQHKKTFDGDKKQARRFSMEYESCFSPHDIENMLDIRDDSNPLHITLGNKSLRNARTHKVSGSYYLSMPSTAKINVWSRFERTKDALAMAYSYNEQTGAYTYRPENVNGNYSTNVNFYFNTPLGTRQIYRLSGRTDWNFRHSVDIVNSAISAVDNHTLNPFLKLSARYTRFLTIGISGNVTWRYATSERENYHTRRTWDLNYGTDLTLNLTSDLHLTTQFGTFQRRGYDDRSMNNTELVWNASLEWNFDFRRSSYARRQTEDDATAKASASGTRPWSLTVKGHDLLQQLSNTIRVLNAQGITETWYNTVPSYVMLSLTYRFAKLPKKRQ